MTVYIGNAWCDENGKAKGGEPGNQTGKELRIIPWYLSEKGWRVFRPTDPAVAEDLVYDMKAAVENKNIGYSQDERNTLYKEAEPYNFDCGDVTVPCSCDCSSLVRVCLAFAGVDVPNFNTASEAKTLLDTGEFEEMEGPEYTDSPNHLKAGDILVTAKTKGHTAIVMNDGADPEPDPGPAPEPDPDPEPGPDPEPPTPPEPEKKVVVVGKSVRVRKNDGPSGKTILIAHNRAWYKEHGFEHGNDKFNLIDVSEATGWYHIETKKGPGYITNKTQYTKLVEV